MVLRTRTYDIVSGSKGERRNERTKHAPPETLAILRARTRVLICTGSKKYYKEIIGAPE